MDILYGIHWQIDKTHIHTHSHTHCSAPGSRWQHLCVWAVMLKDSGPVRGNYPANEIEGNWCKSPTSLLSSLSVSVASHTVQTTTALPQYHILPPEMSWLLYNLAQSSVICNYSWSVSRHLSLTGRSKHWKYISTQSWTSRRSKELQLYQQMYPHVSS